MLYKLDLTRMIAGARDTLLLETKPKSIPIELLVFLLVSMISTIPQSIISTICTMIVMFTDPKYYELIASGSTDMDAINEYVFEMAANLPSWYFMAILLSSGFMIVAALFYCKRFEHRKAYTLGFGKKGFVGEYLMGALIGLVMITLPILVCAATGSVTLALAESIDPLMIVLFFVAFIFQGMGEEALFRGYLMTTLSRRTGLWGAVLINSLMFSLFHIGNSSFSFIAFINIFLFGVFASVFMLKRGSIWAVGAIHSVWNFVQGNIFGFNVSGNPKFDTIWTATGNNFGAILSGGDFGPEGGLGVTVVLLVAILIALIIPTKKSEFVEEKKDEDENNSTEFV